MRSFPIVRYRDRIRDIGRVYTEPGSGFPCLDWSLSGLCFRYIGRVLTGHFTAQSGKEPSGLAAQLPMPSWTVWPRFAVYLDDEPEPHRVFCVDRPDKDEIIFSSDRKEDHVIRIVKLTEALKTGAALDSFFGDGQIIAPRLKKRPRLEVLGDSITLGYGNLGLPTTPGFYSEQEDPSLAYAALAAKELDMELSLVGYSGICAAFDSWNLKPYCMLDLYEYTDRLRQGDVPDEELQRWDFKHHRSDYVLINLGTNDAGAIFCISGSDKPDAPRVETLEARFESCYYDLIAKVRALNGRHTTIICALGDMDYYLFDNISRAAERFIRETGDTRVRLLKFHSFFNRDERGTLNHPGLAANAAMAAQLVRFIKALEAE